MEIFPFIIFINLGGVLKIFPAAALAVDRPLANLLMLTVDDKCPLADEDAD